ncbi:MAG TPA: winged helix-turn-helix domain-containing protein [Thermoanaerobaculia bacterium]|nr:winged helix-turn-helix domain-containing protein [Thermoanaerobaculia bacterium]
MVSQPRLVPPDEDGERVYKFGPFLLETRERVLMNGGTRVPLTPKAFDILLLLVREHGRLVEKGRLMDVIWPDTFVEEKTLTQNIFTLRKVLGANGEGQLYIETVPKYGYRFKANVEVIQRSESCEVVENWPPQPRTIAFHPISNATPPLPASHQGIEAADPPARTADGRWLVRAAFSAAFIAIAVFAAVRLSSRGALASRAFRRTSINRLTDGGDVSALALSPDGKYVAYASARGDGQRLLVRQVDTTSVVEVVPPAPVTYRGITFSRDGAWVYYVTVEKGSYAGTLYRVPLLGGARQRVLRESVGSRVDFSPDGSQVAYVHWSDESHTVLKVANLDGTGDRHLATLDYEDGFSVDGPAWSPDGKTILASTSSYNGSHPYASVVAIDLENGHARRMLGDRWNWIGQVSWLGDGSGVVLTAWSAESDVMSDQVWLMRYPSGDARSLTSDVNGFLGLGVSSDASMIAVSTSISARNFWLLPDGDWMRARKITNGSGDLYSERLGLAWTPDGRVVYSSRQGGYPKIWIMDADGKRQKQLTFDKGTDLQPAVSRDGRFMIYISNLTGKSQLWRMELDGGNPSIIAGTEGAQSASISPDGLWLVYSTRAPGVPRLWRVALSGGSPVPLSAGRAVLPSVSPDGTLIACLQPSNRPGQLKLALLSSQSGRVVKEFDTPIRNTPALKWSPDGRAVTYAVTRDGVSNLWCQPIDGSAPKALTDWKADLVYRFDWSRDGRLMCERGTTVSDVILIREKP